jgi:3-oxoacyl-[acyl-carrier-protein] synthase III
MGEAVAVYLLCKPRRIAGGAHGRAHGHQANLTMLQAVCTAVSVKADRHLFNVDHFGNSGSAGAPSVLSQNWETLNKTCQIRMAVVGAGLTWGGAAIDVMSPDPKFPSA